MLFINWADYNTLNKSDLGCKGKMQIMADNQSFPLWYNNCGNWTFGLIIRKVMEMGPQIQWNEPCKLRPFY